MDEDNVIFTTQDELIVDGKSVTITNNSAIYKIAFKHAVTEELNWFTVTKEMYDKTDLRDIFVKTTRVEKIEYGKSKHFSQVP